MFTFRVLGTVDLRGPDGRRVGSLLSQPKRLALLALLALEAPRRLQRDELMGRLWPEMSEERARNALRQALHYLRRSLGPGIIEGNGGDDIGIAPGKLECDAAELLRAAEEERFGDALDLYEGELLPGFYLDGGPVEFEHWLGDARRRIRRTAAESAQELAKQEEVAGNAVAAGAAARRAWELGDWGEPALRELLKLLIRTGDRSGARNAYREFETRLRHEHGVEPSADTRSILEELAASESGISSSQTAPPKGAPQGATNPTIGSSSAVAPARRRVPWWPAAAAALATLVVGMWTLLPATKDGVLEAAVSVDAPTPSLYLEPVRDLNLSGSHSTLAEAVTAELAGYLSETDGFLVVALRPGEDRAFGSGVRLRPTLRAVGEELQLSVLLLDPSSDAVLERLTVGTVADAATSAEDLSAQMALRIRHAAGEVISLSGLAERGIRPEALDAVREAALEQEAADRLRLQGAREAAGLAYAATDSLLRRAAILERSWPEPTLRRAEITLQSMWLHLIPPNDRPDVAHQEILRGLEHARVGVAIDPEHARAREVRGVLLYWAAQTTSDKEEERTFKEEAERELEEAVRRDAGLSRAWTILSALAEKRGDFAPAYHRARRAYVSDYDLRVPTDILARLFTNALEVGDATGAAEWCAEIRRRESDHWLGPYCDLTHLAWVGPWTVAASDSLVEEGIRLVPSNGGEAHIQARFKLLHGVVLAKAGDAAAARRVLATTEPMGPMSLDLLDLQAWIRTALGDNGQARELLATAADLDPDVAPRVLRSRRYADLSTYTLARSDH